MPNQGEAWPPAETALLKKMVQDGDDCAQIAAKFAELGLSRTYKAISRKVQRERANGHGGWHAQVQASPWERYNQPLTMTAARSVHFADIHAPFHDAGFMNRVIELATRWGCTQCGIMGDLIDMAAFCYYGQAAEITFKDELRATRQILTALKAAFPDGIYCGMGNHEARIERAVDYRADLQTLSGLWVTDKVHLSAYHWYRLDSVGEVYQFEHPVNTSVHATLVPKKLAAKYGCHVVAGHGHGWGISRDDSGRYWAIDAGICADPLRLAYAQVMHNTRPTMCQGAVVVRDGVPVLLSPNNISLYEQMRWA